MNETELQREVLIDMANAFRYEDNNQNRFRRLVLKSTRFPLYSQFAYTSPRKNRWLVLLEARSKKEFGDMSRITYVTTHDTPHGLYAIMVSWVEGRPQLIFFPPHFFSRFRKRMDLEDTGIDLMFRFFRYNASYVYQVQAKNHPDDKHQIEIYGSTKEGVAMGVVSEHQNVLFKTFVTYEMLKGEQVETFTENERIRKEIHES